MLPRFDRSCVVGFLAAAGNAAACSCRFASRVACATLPLIILNPTNASPSGPDVPPAASLNAASRPPGTGHSPEAPTRLTVGDRIRALNVEGAPLFGWLPRDRDGNELQTAYQIIVLRERDEATVWDSGKIRSSDQSYVLYGGPGLDPGTSYLWRVRTWDKTDLQINPPDAGEALTTENFAAIVEHTDVPADGSTLFTSSNPVLNAVWDLLRRSALYGVQHQFVDTPTREKGQFLGDAADISFATMAAWREREATRKALREFANSQLRYWSGPADFGQGLAAAGRPEMVVERLTNSETDGWANILGRGGTFTWEQWNPEGSESYSHPWGAQAAVDVLETLLGIRNGSPGAATIEVTVPRRGINAASGTVKTQRGPVSTSWFRLAGYVQLLVDVPINVQARVTLPLLPGIKFFPIGPGQPRFVGNENGSAIFETGSGQTLFLSVPE